MDESEEDLQKLLAWAIKNEVVAYNTYMELEKKVQNPFLREKLRFLAMEEKLHRERLENMYNELFSEPYELPEDFPTLVPDLSGIDNESTLLEVFKKAMDAETEAAEFYKKLADKVDSERLKDFLIYLSRMELGHYKLLEIEYERIKELGDISTY